MLRYISLITEYGLETIEIVDSEDYKTMDDFQEAIQEKKDMYSKMYGNDVITSSRRNRIC